MNDKQRLYVLVLAIIISLLAYNLWVFGILGFYYKGIALFIVMLAALLVDAYRGKYWLLMTAQVLFLWAMSNLFDELVGDPKKIGWNEYIFALIAFLVVFYKVGKVCGAWILFKLKQWQKW